MKFLKNFVVLAILFAWTPKAFATGDVKYYKDPLRVTFNTNPGKLPDIAKQQQIARGESWKQFLQKAGNWACRFDEITGSPVLAYGEPVTVGGSDPKIAAVNFISNYLNVFSLPVKDFEFVSVSTNAKYHFVNYKQITGGYQVLGTRIQVKMTHDLRVVQFSMDCFNNVNLSGQATIDQVAAVQSAVAGVGGIESVEVGNELKLLPLPDQGIYNYRLVYEITVLNIDAESVPGKYYTLVDAYNGKVLYRANRVLHFANTDVNMSGTLYVTHPYNASSVEPLRNLKVVVGGSDFYTDNLGFVGLTNTSAVNATISLQGLWAKVQTNGTTPSWNVLLNPGVNNLSSDATTDIKQRTTYHAVNMVHDYMKSKFPSFTGMDNPLESNVDVAGSCNAFYNGTSINFFTQGGGCNATSLIADVCYHEYGHGINDNFYQSIGSSWDNGAMGEGYADLWAMGITGSDTLGIGFFMNDPTGFVREYAADKKVYPQDLIGEVHADGEIICGAWWDTYKNLGNLQQMMDLFALTYFSGVTDFDGNEGTLFPAILLEALFADDNDGNLMNGTPNYCAITSAFALHGIGLNGIANLNHTEVSTHAPLSAINVAAVVTGLPAGSIVSGYFRVGNTGSWNQFTMNNIGGTNYQGAIPAQGVGTIIEYYLGVEDNCGTLTGVTPFASNDTINPNIPYYILVGYSQLLSEDFDNTFGNWTLGLPSDNATTGMWDVDLPVPSYVNGNLVQTDDDHTPFGLFCALTGNAPTPQDGAGVNDVDGGKTTLVTPVFDLTSYTNPAITYWRWYSNDQGATPGTDFWQVYISGDGINYVPVENTRTADHSWRRFAFRIQDYITPTSTVTLRFVAEDANAGSLVEAAVDDFVIWDEVGTGISDLQVAMSMSVYPNPVHDVINIILDSRTAAKGRLEVINHLGQNIASSDWSVQKGKNTTTVDLQGMAAGIYQVKLTIGNQTLIRKVSLQ